MLSLRLLALLFRSRCELFVQSYLIHRSFCSRSFAKCTKLRLVGCLPMIASVLQNASLGATLLCHGADGDPPAADTTRPLRRNELETSRVVGANPLRFVKIAKVK